MVRTKSSSKKPAAGTRGQNAYKAILAAVRDHRYLPGDPLREAEVARFLGTSRTPVREAFGRLQERGILEAGPNRGLVVATLTMQEVMELYSLREELEGAAARLAAAKIDEVQLENLQRLNDEFRASVGDTRSTAKLNRLFHTRLYDAAQNRFLNQALDDLQDTSALLRTTTFDVKGRIEDAYREHINLIDALRSRDQAAARLAACAHIRSSLRIRLQIER